MWAHAQTLTRLPALGRPGRIAGTRELVIRRTSYILVYRLAGDTVEILRILHSARQWPAELGDEQ
ncbi:type II toxin-antitoxin system RelE/ParE family toxin [Inquilinus sp. Marseille-Q2685]|uniref:type II toxin-antitoxin system RelE/ParE family toxin n=1 Tax=Inquilinus sp. Marseille-Q2685 TaxID=2866581 RepID=UPI0035AB822B